MCICQITKQKYSKNYFFLVGNAVNSVVKRTLNKDCNYTKEIKTDQNFLKILLKLQYSVEIADHSIKKSFKVTKMIKKGHKCQVRLTLW